MNLVTIIWSFVASACLTLAAMNLLVWLNKRTARANLLISVMAAATAFTAFFELAMMEAETAAAYGRFMRLVQIPLWVVVVSLVLFVRQYLRAGRPWLAWTVCGMRTLSLILNFVFSPNLHYREIISLDHLHFLGETISVAKGVPNPWMLTAQASTLLLVIFVVDAAVTVHRRGGSRSAVLMSSAIIFFVAASMIQAALVFWWRVPIPITISFFSLGLVAAIAYEMSLDMQRAAQLSEDLRTSKKDLQRLAGRLISAQEEELRRLSRELHDDLTQRLAVLAIEAGKLELDMGKMPAPFPETVHTVAQIKNQLIKVSEDVHTISRQLHPTILDDLGLVRAIESECAAVMRRHPVGITFSRENVSNEIPDDISLCLYRVVQEGLKNIAVHSQSKNCEIFLRGDDHVLCLTVSDDGIGFDPLEVRKLPGLGLSSMRERIQLIQGDFSIRSQPGKGTVISVCVPLTGGDA